MNEEIYDLLRTALEKSQGSRIQRIQKQPIKLLFSKILEQIALISHKAFKINITTFWGEKMLVIIPETVSGSLCRYGFFEEGLTKMILDYLKPGMTFFDIGAHFGYYTLLGSFIVGHEGKVHAFDPTPSTFDILETNSSKKPNVVINNLAVASKRNKILINDYGVRYSSFNSVYNARLPKNIISKLNTKRYEIQAISIDEYVEDKNLKPDFIKIDAESSEYEILLGMEHTIDKFHPIITVEVGDYNIEGVTMSKNLIEFLINKGYKPYEFKDGKSLPHALKDTYTYENILFIQKE